MLGKPKYDYNDIVKFKIRMSDDEDAKEVEGSIAIIDRWGTFEQNKEVSYDIYSIEDNILYKHIQEPELTYVRKGTEEEGFDYYNRVVFSHRNLIMSVAYIREHLNLCADGYPREPFIYLRPIRESDKDDIQRMMDDSKVYKYVPTFVPEKKYKTAEEFIHNAYYDELKVSCILAIVEVSDIGLEHFCGFLELYYFKEIKNEVYIGLRLARYSWGNNIAERVLSILIPHLTAHTEIDSIKATTMKDNEIVNNILENVSFEKVGEAEEDWGFETKVPVYKWVHFLHLSAEQKWKGSKNE